ncbi:MAG: hypothetical protein ACR2J9_11275 [Gaiellales bacterium]
MSTVIEYTLRPKAAEYDALLGQYIRLADDVADNDLAVRLIMVAGDADQRVIRSIGVYGAPDGADVALVAAFHRNVRDRLEGDVERSALELIHLHARKLIPA